MNIAAPFPGFSGVACLAAIARFHGLDLSEPYRLHVASPGPETSSSMTHEIYSNYYLRARVYESVIRDEYLNFIVANPKYAFKLLTYYKPKEILNVLATLVGPTAIASGALVVVSLACMIALLAWPINGPSSRFELAITLGVVWLGSFLPILWAYPAPHVFADLLWSILFALLALFSFSAAALVRRILWRRQPDMDEPQAEQPRRPQIVP